MKPTWVADAHNLSAVPLDIYDLVLADPPYSVEDAERYQTTMVQRNVVMRSLAAGMASGARVVWLDQVLPMYRKDEWAIEAVIGMVKSTNHRFRVTTIFRRLDRSHPRKVAQRPTGRLAQPPVTSFWSS
jgi:16S rRNA G966 N2-methylase RsmD